MNDTDSTAGMLRDAAVDFFSSRPQRERLRGWVGRARSVDRALWRESAELGWTVALLPESLGGLALSLRDVAVLCEEAGRHLYAEPLVAAAILPALVLGAAEESGQAAELAEILAGGEQLVTLAWQEAAGQFDLSGMQCTIKDGRISGRKLFVPACEEDSIALVYAMHGGEPVWVAVDMQAQGVHRDAVAAGLGSHATLVFDNAPLRDTQPLLAGAAAQRVFTQMLNAGRVAAAAELSGFAAGCLAQTVDYVRERQQFDRAIGSFQSVQHRCVDLYIESELSIAAVEHALKQYEIDPLAACAAICAAKARAGDAAVRTGRESVQMHGAMGFCEEVDIGLYLRSAIYMNAWLGAPTILRRCFAKEQSQQAGVVANG